MFALSGWDRNLYSRTTKDGGHTHTPWQIFQREEDPGCYHSYPPRVESNNYCLWALSLQKTRQCLTSGCKSWRKKSPLLPAGQEFCCWDMMENAWHYSMLLANAHWHSRTSFYLFKFLKVLLSCIRLLTSTSDMCQSFMHPQEHQSLCL